MRRRLQSLSMACILIVSVMLTACASPQPATSSAGSQSDTEISMVYFVAGSTSQLRADAIVEAVRMDHPDWRITSRAAGGEARLIASRLASESDFFHTTGSRPLEVRVQAPLHPEVDYELASEYRTVMPSFLMHVHLLALESTGLTAPGDIVEREYPFRLGCGAGVAKEIFSLILQYYGSSLEEAASWGGSLEALLMVAPEGVEALQSGRIDMGLTYAGIPNPILLRVHE